MQQEVPEVLRTDAVFAEVLTNALLSGDQFDAPSANTLQILQWVCQAGTQMQTGCCWGVYKATEHRGERAILFLQLRRFA